jgi:hypothetical protein
MTIFLLLLLFPFEMRRTGVSYFFLFGINYEKYSFVRLVGFWIVSLQGLWRKHETIATHHLSLYFIHCLPPSVLLLFLLIFFRYLPFFKLPLYIYLRVISCPIRLCPSFLSFLSSFLAGWCFQNDGSMPANSRNVSSCRP